MGNRTDPLTSESRFVLERADVHSFFNLANLVSKAQLARRVEHGVPTQKDDGLEFVSLQFFRKLLDCGDRRGSLRIRQFGERNCFPVVAKLVVQAVY